MQYKADLHIHTVASGHAYSTVDEIIRSAKEKGLEVIGITDHSNGMPGGAHPFHFQNLKVIPKEVYGVRVLRGVEANIVDYEGNLDVAEEVLQGLDVVIASLHPPCIPFADADTLTPTLEAVMENKHVHIIGHPGDARYPYDAERIAKKAKETGTLLEINNASLRPGSFRPGVRENLIELLGYCKVYGTYVIVNTDSHICYEVGEVEESLALLAEIDFPASLVINTDAAKLLDFISSK